MLKTIFQPYNALPATSIDDSKVVSSSDRNHRKSAQSIFTKYMCGVSKPRFLTPNTRRALTKLKLAFIKAPIL